MKKPDKKFNFLEGIAKGLKDDKSSHKKMKKAVVEDEGESSNSKKRFKKK